MNLFMRSGIFVLLTFIFIKAQNSVAVMNFRNNGPADINYLSGGIPDMLITSLSQSSEIKIVERNQLQSLIKEMKLGMSGLVDANSAAEIGKLAGARFVVIGSFMKLGQSIRVDAKVVNVESGIIIPGSASSVKAKSIETIDLSSDQLAKALLRNLTGESVKVQIKGDPSLEATLEWTYPNMKRVLFINGKQVGDPFSQSRTSIVKLGHGKHKFDQYKNGFVPKLLVTEYLELAGGYIYRASLENGKVKIYSVTPAPELGAVKKALPKENTAVTAAKNPVITTTTKKTTTESPKTTTTETVSFGFTGMPGMKVKMTTETSHESSSSSGSSNTHQNTDQINKPVNQTIKEPAAMSSSAFNNLLSHLMKEGFEDTRLNIMKSAVKNKNIDINQFIQLIKIYSFDDNQIESFKIGYPRLIDKDEIYQAYSAFQFDATKEEVRQWVENQQ